MEINDDAKEIVQKLGEAINSAVERSHEVAEAIEHLRQEIAQADAPDAE